MRLLIVGLGVQGQKRKIHAGKDFVASVDPINPAAEFTNIAQVPLSDYDAVCLCTPEKQKTEIISYLIKNRKHVLVEKPLWVENLQVLQQLQAEAQAKAVVCYTAYNHRFEPHIKKMYEVLSSGVLGTVYYCRLFYGNGTANVVKNSPWRDQGAGVLLDLGSHLFNIIDYWFDAAKTNTITYKMTASDSFETQAPDHVIINSDKKSLAIALEMSLVSWRNEFTCDIIAEKGSAHIRSLCKWGPSEFIYRQRVMPSGYPIEEKITLTEADPTWQQEYNFFKQLCANHHTTDLRFDINFMHIMSQLTAKPLLEPKEKVCSLI